MFFRILGTVEAWTGQEWRPISATKWRLLLAVLLVRSGQPVPVDRLVEEIWGDRPPKGASNLVSVYVHKLRRLIGDEQGKVLVTRAPGYAAVLKPGELDADRFAELVTLGRKACEQGDAAGGVELLTQALEMWRGEPLADARAAPLVATEAEHLAESRVQATELRIQARLACGRHAEVVPEVHRLLVDFPLRERLWALLMQALWGAGRQAEALETYHQAQETIAEELGVDPGAELQQIYQQILNADSGNAAAARTGIVSVPVSAPAPVVPAQLPPDIADFTGRAGQVAAVRGMLAPSGDGDGEAAPRDGPGVVRVALVVGSGGLGKTALAVHAAHAIAHQFPDGRLYANLRGATHPANPADMLARFLRDLGMDAARIPVDEEERALAYRTRLDGKRVLIVLDDARDAEQVAPLLPGSSSCAVLITSRARMPELVGISVLDLDVLPDDEARTLFAKVAGQAKVSDDPGAAASVLAVCAGLPLAIRIAGARLASGSWNVRLLAERLANERRRLDVLRAGNLAVRASFEVSFAHLPQVAAPGAVDPARVFALLGLWTGPSISLPAVAALVGEPTEAVSEALDVLLDAHLLEAIGPEQYRFHDLLRVYAADRALTQEPDQERLTAVTRLLTWYLHTTEAAACVISPQHTPVPLGPPPARVSPLAFGSLDAALQWCESKRTGLVAATRLAASSGLHEIAWKLAAASMNFFYRSSHWVEWVTTHEIGLASARLLGDRMAEAWMRNNLGMAYGQKHMTEAVEYFEQALAICQDIGDTRGETRGANNLATAYFRIRRFPEALEAAQRSLVIQRKAGNRYGEGIAINMIGCSSRELGWLQKAADYLQQALDIFRELGEQHTVADSLGDLGETYLGLGEIERAIACLRESLSIWRDIGDRYGQAKTLQRFGNAQQRAGNLIEAATLLGEAIVLFEDLGNHGQAAEARAALVEIEREVGGV
jgi:DNA-binding SARP family transcriptional activator/tetratricopeptide (TPR) repeat protein